MSAQDIKDVLNVAKAALNAGDLDGLMACYADDAVLMVPGREPIEGPDNIRATLDQVSAYFNHTLHVSQSDVHVLPVGDLALATALTTITATMADGCDHCEQRTSTYIFKRQEDGRWLCAIDNSYGTAMPCQPKLEW